MRHKRRQHSGECTARVALAAIRGEQTVHEWAAEYGVHPVPISPWQRAVQDAVPRLFSSRRGRRETAEEERKATVDQPSGPRQVEVDGVKKTAGLPRGHQAAEDRGRPSPEQSPASVGVTGAAPSESVVPGARSPCGDAPPEAAPRGAVHGDPVVRYAPHDGLAAHARVSGAPSARGAAEAAEGDGSALGHAASASGHRGACD